MTTSRKFKPLSFALDLLIDFALIGLGCVIIYHFFVSPLGPFDLWPMVVGWFGGNKPLAVAVIAAVPILVGVGDLVRNVVRALVAARNRPTRP